MNKLKLFVWDEFCPEYTDGLAFAIAYTDRKLQQEPVKFNKVDI